MEDHTHDGLFSPAVLVLGKIHWALLRASSLMNARRFRNVKRHGELYTQEWTDFGKEIGADEINWWVFKKETQIHELRVETETALNAAQMLKEGSERLERLHPGSYDELVSTLKEFAGKHSGEIDLLYAYVQRLEARDPMAAKILFTYRVWGSTRMGDRSISIPSDPPTLPDADHMRTCAEIVLGLRDYSRTTLDRLHDELAFEILESMDPEQMSEDVRIEVPSGRLLARASWKIYAECATYFEEIRDSLRNILIDIVKFEEQRELMKSDAFWRDFILKAVKTKKTETQLWDFKKTLTIWHVNKDPERQEAKVDFAENVASFANASGGVLIVGVTDRREIVGVGDPRDLENRLKDASNVLAKHLQCDRDIAAFWQVEVPVKGEKKVCLVIVVAQARDVVGVDNGGARYSYPVRRETDVERVPNTDLGKRKIHIKSDNHDFIRDLKQFIVDN